MTSYFYSHLIKIDSLTTSLEELDLTQPQEKHLSKLVDSTLHHTILDLILSQLSATDKKIFLEKLSHNPSDEELMEFLKTKIDKIEDQISQTASKLKTELHEDIKEAKLSASQSKKQ